MKLIVISLCVLGQFLLSSCGKLPEYLPEPCRKSDPDFRGCVLKKVEKAGPYFLKGIPEFNVPKLDPLDLPLITVNRTINDFISISAVIKNLKAIGLSTIYINDFKADLDNLVGELKVTMPKGFVSMEYDVVGKLLDIPLESEGYMRGNFTNTLMHFKGSLKPVVRNGIRYFALDKFKLKTTVGDGYVKMVAKDSRYQFAANLIADFFNENPRRFMDAINPYYSDAGADFFRTILEKTLATVPADELLPE